MTALTADRLSTRNEGHEPADPVAAAVKIFQGAIVVLDASGNAKPCVTATGLTGRGIAQSQVDNSTGAAGAATIKTIRRGWHKVANAGDITRANINASAYGVDDQTVSASSASGTRSVIGTIRQVDTDGVWISFS